ncbi:MAG: hypothetical protein C4K58_08495 [Flavobacteriaceae bacterium]|nr:MAG: hypothetical protein C4K58_08495 [Flavobacteriaceae bacterium]
MNKLFKLLIAALLIGLGIYFITERETGTGVFLILLSAVPIFLYFRNEYMLLAFWFIRKQDLEKAKNWLSKITNYKSQLIPNQYGYFHYLSGMTLGQDNIAESEKMMKKALEYGLNFGHDRALAKLNLAGVAMSKGQKNIAKKLLEEAKSEDNQGMLKEQFKMMEQQMKKLQNQPSALQNPQLRKGRYF